MHKVMATQDIRWLRMSVEYNNWTVAFFVLIYRSVLQLGKFRVFGGKNYDFSKY
jgi:hypothetical protein